MASLRSRPAQSSGYPAQRPSKHIVHVGLQEAFPMDRRAIWQDNRSLMKATQFAMILLLGICTATGADTDWHTPPGEWNQPRIYHRPFDERFASQILLNRCAVPSMLPELKMSPNDVYWFAIISPNRTKNGPWHTDVLIDIERDYLLRIQFRDIHYCRDIEWVNEKLLRIRVWWGRICATDLIVDVEQEQIIYKEMVWYGLVPYQQFQQAKQNPPPHIPKNDEQQIHSDGNRETSPH